MFETTLANGVLETHFDSVTEWVSQIKEDWYGHSTDWYGGYTTFTEAYKASLSCNKYTKQIESVVSKLVNMIQASMPDMVPGMDVTGLGYDVGLALTGVPECWLTTQISKDPRVVRILFHMGADVSVKPETIIARGIGIAALVKCLELAGVSTEVTVCAGGMPPSRTMCMKGLLYFVTIKKADDYFDLEKFSFAICDPGFYRRIGFAWMKTKAKVRHCGMMGNAYVQSDLDRKGKEYDMYISGYSYMSNEIEIRKWVIGKCKEFGVEISELS